MKLFDLTQEVFSCRVYPGDPIPQCERIASMDAGDACHLTAFSMCAHNGTHVDAPFHFIRKGETVDALPLEKTVGPAYVAECNGIVGAEEAKAILEKAGRTDPQSARRILLKGKLEVSEEAARVFAEAKLDLLGNESQTVGPENAPMAVHLVLLSAKTVLLEGICLNEVEEGVYFLSAAPLKLGGADGAPCRAYLIRQ